MHLLLHASPVLGCSRRLQVQHQLWLVCTDSDAAGMVLPLGVGVAGAVFSSGQTINIADAYQDSRFDPSTDTRTGFTTRNILAVPMLLSGRVVGVRSQESNPGPPSSFI